MSKTRTDRLLELLRTATSPAVRMAAAGQLGALCTPGTALPLLRSILPVLRAKKWDVRTAAAAALEGVLATVPRAAAVVFEDRRCAHCDVAALSKEHLLSGDAHAQPPKQKRARKDAVGAGDAKAVRMAYRKKTEVEPKAEEALDAAVEVAAEDLEDVCGVLRTWLLDSVWETRHGSALGLREFFVHQGCSADLLCMCVDDLLALMCRDRFSDFMFAQQVAPVRETAAQALAAALKGAPRDYVFSVIDVLLEMTECADSVVKYSGLVGLKFVLVAANGFDARRIFDRLFCLLSHEDDEIVAVCVGTMHSLLDLLDDERYTRLLRHAVTNLDTSDDLCVANRPFFELIAAMFEDDCAKAMSKLTDGMIDGFLKECVPFIHHAIGSVRKSCLTTIAKIVPHAKLESETGKMLADHVFKLIMKGEETFGAWEALFSGNRSLCEDCDRLVLKWVQKCTELDHVDMVRCAYALDIVSKQLADKSALFGAIKQVVETKSDFGCIILAVMTKDGVVIPDELYSLLLSKLNASEPFVAAAVAHWKIPSSVNAVIKGVLGGLAGNTFSPEVCDVLCDVFYEMLDTLRHGKQQLVDLMITATEKSANLERIVEVIAKRSGAETFEHFPKLHGLIDDMTKSSVFSLKVFAVLARELSDHFASEFVPPFERVLARVKNETDPKCEEIVCEFCKHAPEIAVPLVIERLLSDLNEHSAHCVQELVLNMGTEIVPFASAFVEPLLECMSSRDLALREACAYGFGNIVRLLPLNTTDDVFFNQLLKGQHSAELALPFNVNAELRRFQRQGVNWLLFLQKHHLHGILCDDMGLGKTLQALCAVAMASLGQEKPSLVVCPTTVRYHWASEIRNFFSSDVLQHVLVEDVKNFSALSGKHVVIVAYTALRNYIDKLSKTEFSYCVLDEGHIIKNHASQTFKNVKMINATFRLILSGTPIQNDVVEMWSLFDFLMPGLLGDVKSFRETYARPIMLSRRTTCRPDEKERGEMKMEALHRQVQPFLLRRVKEDVLDDLPPKTIQDVIVDLTPVQQMLYEDFLPQVDTKDLAVEGGVLKALWHLQKVCSHPALVHSKSLPVYNEVESYLRSRGKSITDVSLSGKLIGLMDLLGQCAGHKALIFCQTMAFLDIVQDSISHLNHVRLDGSVTAAKRQEIVDQFNRDPSIAVMLLTTKAGGLGLNLTGADTVIFLEHDWNPFVDAQAMDRAHRIGQQRPVNVYRILTRGTIEEKILNLQNFKRRLESIVVGKDDGEGSSLLSSLDITNVLDLFAPPERPRAKDASEEELAMREAGLSHVALEMIEEMDLAESEERYTTEFSLSDFALKINFGRT